MTTAPAPGLQLWLDGSFHPADAPVLRAQDRGFRFGDGLFETLRIEGGVPAHWDRHIARLEAGLAALSICADVDGMQAAARTLLHRNSVTDGILRIAVSRGAGSRGYLPVDAIPTLLIEAWPAEPPRPEPAALWLSAQRRAGATMHKTAQGLASTLALLEAHEHGSDEALLLSEADHVAEAASANIVWLADGTLHTPSLASSALAGITRGLVLEHSHWPVREGEYPLAALEYAEAVALLNSGCDARAVSALQPQGWRWQREDFATDLRSLLIRLRAADRVAQQHRWR